MDVRRFEHAIHVDYRLYRYFVQSHSILDASKTFAGHSIGFCLCKAPTPLCVLLHDLFTRKTLRNALWRGPREYDLANEAMMETGNHLPLMHAA